LPIDPKDIGESYEAVIRVNSQSGKGGVAWVLEQDRGLKLPRALQIDFSRRVQAFADDSGKETTGEMIWSLFSDIYHLNENADFELLNYKEGRSARSGEARVFAGRLRHRGKEIAITGRGNGLISSVISALQTACGIDLDVVDYHEHSLKKGTYAQAAAYIECRTQDGRKTFGVGIDNDIATASVRAVLSAAANTVCCHRD
jgi:2-isopropylmalate synthase